ncbi:hypothetical protein OQ496_07590 [Acetobacter suratthaniensis]|uniref:Uncharacterized protein n=1 Tax=Acetobacter suratthaniensis TaxID=1502841 RepID=A0ABS3LLF8_9PROT|nr:hypothetical protein [Acetobacter suratthaniensis]MBO1328195.1 hypothetical protein [Acetobacter suratthaniensis]MCX2566316.1 hypothetical protein [Acetobacter suratthaniensis]
MYFLTKEADTSLNSHRHPGTTTSPTGKDPPGKPTEPVRKPVRKPERQAA